MARDQRQTGLPGLANLGEVGARKSRDDAGRRAHRLQIYLADSGVRVRAAQEHGMRHAGRGDVVGIITAAGDGALCLWPRHGLADETVG